MIEKLDYIKLGDLLPLLQKLDEVIDHVNRHDMFLNELAKLGADMR